MRRYTRSWLNLLLLALPATVIVHYMHGSALVQFILACLSIVPLAGLMGNATEELADRAGSGIGGLLNATFGNAAELIIAIVALQKGLVSVVKASLTGSIIGNLLFVMGLSFVVGGMRYRKQVYDRTAATAGIAMLAVALIGLVIPATYHHLVGAHVPAERLPTIETMSLLIAGVLMLNYMFGLVFSLKTHKQHYNPEIMKDHKGTGASCEQGHGAEDYLRGGNFDEDDVSQAASSAPGDAHGPLWIPILVLLLATVGVVISSEILVGAIEPVMHRLGLRELFVGAVIIAIIGNAAEHSTAVMMAWRNKMDLAMQISVGSSIQIALFVTPLLVFVSLLFPTPMDLEFTVMEILAILATTFIVLAVASDGESNWFEGVQLLSLYAVLAVAFYFTPTLHSQPAVGTTQPATTTTVPNATSGRGGTSTGGTVPSDIPALR